jgi:hypothetical protein
MRTWVNLALAFVLPGTLSCGGAPCTKCENVAGIYQETRVAQSVDCGDDRILEYNGGPGFFELTQHGSALSTIILSGQLHEDLSATFGPAPGVAIGIGSAAMDEPGTVTLKGQFAGSGSQLTFTGTYAFVADIDGCEVDAAATWTPAMSGG